MLVIQLTHNLCPDILADDLSSESEVIDFEHEDSQCCDKQAKRGHH